MIAYAVMSHKNPAQVVRLVDVLLSEGIGQVIVHHDFSRSELRLDHRRAHLIQPTVPVTWGTFSQVEAVLACMRWFLAEMTCEWFVLLSGQCYPVWSLPRLEDFLAHSPYDGYLRGVLIVGSEEECEPGGCVKVNGCCSLCVERYSGVASHKGSDWFALRRKCVEYVVEADPGRFRDVFLPCEVFYHTLLLNEPRFKICRHSLHYVVWPAVECDHPCTFGVGDIVKVLASGKPFARKFEDGAVLDMLDRHRRIESWGPN